MPGRHDSVLFLGSQTDLRAEDARSIAVREIPSRNRSNELPWPAATIHFPIYLIYSGQKAATEKEQIDYRRRSINGIDIRA